MEKNLKRIKTIAVVLVVVLLSAIAFGGLYLKSQGVWKNVLPEFSYGMELDGVRELRFSLDTSEEEKEIYLDKDGNYAGDVVESHDHEEETTSDTQVNLVDENGNPLNNSEETTTEPEEKNPEESTSEPEGENTEKVTNEAEKDEVLADYTTETRTIKANPEESINIDNFEKSKKIIQKRLENVDLYEYNIRLDNVTGDLIVEVPDNDNVSIEQSLVMTRGKFEVIDHDNGIILLDNSDVKNVSATYTNNESGYQAYLIISLNKPGAEKLKSISEKYVSTTLEDGTTETKGVAVKFDGQELIETYFGDKLENGVLQIPLGQATTSYEDFVVTFNNSVRIAQILSSEMLPLSYTLTADNLIQSEITNETEIVAVVSFAIIVLIISIVMVVKYKLRGLKLAVLNVGYIAILTLIFRYTNVLITLNSLIAFVGVCGVNLLFEFKLLANLKGKDDVREVFGKTMKELYLAIIPVIVIAIVFTFMSGAVISSIGMVLFWGLAVGALYNGLLYLIGMI